LTLISIGTSRNVVAETLRSVTTAAAPSEPRNTVVPSTFTLVLGWVMLSAR
jgi:hypothetical protein